MNPEELEGRLTTVYEKTLTTLVDDIEHIESDPKVVRTAALTSRRQLRAAKA
jgi:hypothetical protein